MHAIIYARVSTRDQAASGLGIEAQIARCRAWAEYRGYQVTEVVSENGVSGTLAPDARPGLGRALHALTAGQADALVVAKLDRLGRDVADVLALADTAERQGWSLAVLDLDLDTSTPGGRLVLTMFAALARWERDIIAERTSAALQALKRRGKRLGRPVEQSPTARRRIEQLRQSGLSMAATAVALNAEGIPTARGGRWHGSTVASLERSATLDAEAGAGRNPRNGRPAPPGGAHRPASRPDGTRPGFSAPGVRGRIKRSIVVPSHRATVTPAGGPRPGLRRVTVNERDS